MENVKLINKKLIDMYGKSVTGQPYYRLVWSEDMYEIRKGDFDHHTASGIYLGTQYNVVDRVKKYGYFKDRYVLETFAPELQAMAQAVNKELVELDGYEPLFVFTDKNRNYLKPEWWAIEYLIRRHREVIAHVEKRTDAMDKKVHEEEIEKEAEVFVDYLENESSNLMNKFRHQEAVLIHRDKN